MAKKSTKLLEMLKKKIDRARELHEFEWDWLKRSCPHRKRRKDIDNKWEYGCKICNESSANTKNYFHYCHFSNCHYT